MRKKAFTLVELLVVITIIMLLAGILLPSLQRAALLAQKAKSMAYMKDITTRIEVYKNDKRYYPLQYDRKPATKILTYAGKQLKNILAAEGLKLTYDESPSGGIGDKFPDPMPFLYYPSILGNDGTVGRAYKFEDNQYFGGMASTVYAKPSFYRMISEDGSGNINAKAIRSQSYLLIGAGGDRRYYLKENRSTSEDAWADNVANFLRN